MVSKRDVTTIQVSKELLVELKSIKRFSRQSYSELLLDLIKTFKKAKRTSEYDSFLFNIQKQKMKELWDNKADEVWDNV